MPTANPPARVWCLRFKLNRTTILLHTDAQQTFSSIRSELLTALKSTNPSRILTGTLRDGTPVSYPLPESAEDIALAKPADINDASAGWEAIGDDALDELDFEDESTGAGSKGKGKAKATPQQKRASKSGGVNDCPQDINALAASTTGTPTPSRPSTPFGPVEDEYELMTVNEIINGQDSPGGFPGLIPLVEMYLDSLNVDVETRCELAQYLALIRGRADGSLWTAARWIRHFVRGHAKYEGDSVVNEEVSYDLVKAAERVTIHEARDGFGKEMFGRTRMQRNGVVG